ncbi:MAG: ATP-binding protein [Acidaminococcaceae bacterium]|nr:ATP-binding protein [Acidaminococcaceae bacterium]
MGIGKEKTGQENDNATAKKEIVIEFNPVEPKYGLEDLILQDITVSKIRDIASYAENSNKVFEEWGFADTHKYSRRCGINLWGAPGTGKTMAAHAIAKNLGRKIILVDYADIESKYVGDTSKNLRRAFEKAKETGAILFFDEADAILSRRVTGMEHATDVSVNQTRSELLMLLNEFNDVIIFATNFIENFDPAFMRRILLHVKFELPDEKCREQLWYKYIPEKLPHDIDIPKIVELSDGLSGGDISNAILSAAFSAVRQNESVLHHTYLEDAVIGIKESKEANQKRHKKTVKVEEISKEEIPEGITPAENIDPKSLGQ